MIKKLLSAAFLAGFALSANAYEVNDYVYTKTARYQVTGGNLVVNGQFKEGDDGLTGWDTISSEQPFVNTFMMLTDGPNGSNTQQVLAGAQTLLNGMRQNIHVTAPGHYVVSFYVKGMTSGITDLELAGGSNNYMNAYYNTDKSLATGLNAVGADGVRGGYEFSYADTLFTPVAFAIEVPAEGYIVIDFRGMVEGIEIADVECHQATLVYDDRVARKRIAWMETILNGEGVDELSYYTELQAEIEGVEGAIEANTVAESSMENLEMLWELFISENFENVLEAIPTTDGSNNTGNNSANWMNWTSKYSKMNAGYNGKAPWKFSTDRWGHSAGSGNPIGISWQRGVKGPYNNVATLTATLTKGTYYMGVSGDAGHNTKVKQSWSRTMATDCGGLQLFFNGDTTDVVLLSPGVTNDYIYAFTLEENKEITLGFICNTTVEHNLGFSASLYDPILIKVINPEELTTEQVTYLGNVQKQLDVLADRLATANGYLSAANDTLPWGKETLKVGTDEAQTRYDAWMAMKQDEVLAMLENGEALADTIMNKGVRFITNEYINPFLAINKPLTDMPAAIEAAQKTLSMRMYGSSSKKGELETEIAESQAMYTAKLAVPFSSADSLALINQKADLAAAVELFKANIEATTLIDIDFGTQDAPAVFNKKVEVDTLGVETVTYVINGAKGYMEFTAVNGTVEGETANGNANSFELGYNNTDSLGMLRVGNTEAFVPITGAPVKGSDIVNIKFDFYYGSLNGRYAGFKVLGEAGDTICIFYLSRYDGKVAYDNMNIGTATITGVGSSQAGNAAIAQESANRTTFELILDYGKKMMYCNIDNAKNGTRTTEEVALKNSTPAKFVLYSNYGTDGRRCWFDNFKVINIAADETEGIEAIKAAQPVTGSSAMYNLMGQQILKPTKGQIYIQGGVKKIGK